MFPETCQKHAKEIPSQRWAYPQARFMILSPIISATV